MQNNKYQSILNFMITQSLKLKITTPITGTYTKQNLGNDKFYYTGTFTTSTGNTSFFNLPFSYGEIQNLVDNKQFDNLYSYIDTNIKS